MASHFRLPRTKIKTGLGLVMVAVLVLAGPASLWGQDAGQQKARDMAGAFLRETEHLTIQQISAIALTWQVRMKGRFNIRIRMNATARLERSKNRFVSTFNLTEPQGRDAWSWFLLNLFGRHTREYRQLMRSVEVNLVEHLILEDSRFVTQSLEEILPAEKRYAGQTAIRIAFSKNPDKVVFWPDKTMRDKQQSLPWTDQMGPLTAFFNYLFFLPQQTEIRIINALKQAIDAPEDSGAKSVVHQFGSETARLGPNRTGRHPAFAMAIELEKGNFLDILYGNNIFFQLASGKAGRVKVPHTISMEGVISKNGKMKRLRMLRKQHPDRTISDKEIFADLDAVLAARDVSARLVDYTISLATPSQTDPSSRPRPFSKSSSHNQPETSVIQTPLKSTLPFRTKKYWYPVTAPRGSG